MKEVKVEWKTDGEELKRKYYLPNLTICQVRNIKNLILQESVSEIQQVGIIIPKNRLVRMKETYIKDEKPN